MKRLRDRFFGYSLDKKGHLLLSGRSRLYDYRWTQFLNVTRSETTQADFEQGMLDGVVATSDENLELLKFTDNYDTDPVAAGRFAALSGTWTWDGENQWLKQTNSARSQHWGVEVGFAFASKVDFEFDMAIQSDPSGRIHSGAFIQTVPGEVTGYRISHLDNSWCLSKWDNGVETYLPKTIINYTPLEVGQTVRIRVIHDFGTGGGALYVDGIMNLTWTDTSYSQGRPGYHSYGNVTCYDNLISKNHIESGSRISPALDLSPAVIAASSRIEWEATEPTGTNVTIETSLDNGATWQTAVNGGTIPGINPGDYMADKMLLVKQTLSTDEDPTVTPQLHSIYVFVEAVGGAIFFATNF